MQIPTPDATPTPHFTGRAVIDEHGEPLGSVDDVIFDQNDETPEYLIVKPGLLRRAHYVPVDGAYESIEGDIVVPWDRQWFKQSPVASREHVLTPIERVDVDSHYAHH